MVVFQAPQEEFDEFISLITSMASYGLSELDNPETPLTYRLMLSNIALKLKEHPIYKEFHERLKSDAFYNRVCNEIICEPIRANLTLRIMADEAQALRELRSRIFPK